MSINSMCILLELGIKTTESCQTVIEPKTMENCGRLFTCHKVCISIQPFLLMWLNCRRQSTPGDEEHPGQYLNLNEWTLESPSTQSGGQDINLEFLFIPRRQKQTHISPENPDGTNKRPITSIHI
jgi:hypothetical protein